MVISERQRLYAEARASGLNKRASAVAAGCPEKTASQQASRLEKDEAVIAHWKRMGFDPEAPVERGPRPSTVKAAEYVSERAKRPMDEFEDPVEYMRAVVNNPMEDPKLRLDAAKAWDAAIRGRAQAKGKKGEQAEKAKKASGKFGVPTPPPLKAVK